MWFISFQSEHRELGIWCDLRQKDLDGGKKVKDQEMGTNSAVGMKRWKDEREGEMVVRREMNRDGKTKIEIRRERQRTRETDGIKQSKMGNGEKARETKKMRETGREGQRGPYQCIAGGIRCNWGVCVCMCVCLCY